MVQSVVKSICDLASIDCKPMWLQDTYKLNETSVLASETFRHDNANFGSDLVSEDHIDTCARDNLTKRCYLCHCRTEFS